MCVYVKLLIDIVYLTKVYNGSAAKKSVKAVAANQQNTVSKGVKNKKN